MDIIFEKEEFYLGRDDIERALRTAPRGTSFAMHTRCEFVNSKGDLITLKGSTYVNLSRKEAIRVALDFLPPILEKEGAHLRLTTRKHSGQTTYWLG